MYVWENATKFVDVSLFITSEQNVCHFAKGRFEYMLLNENQSVWIEI